MENLYVRMEMCVLVKQLMCMQVYERGVRISGGKCSCDCIMAMHACTSRSYLNHMTWHSLNLYLLLLALCADCRIKSSGLMDLFSTLCEL